MKAQVLFFILMKAIKLWRLVIIFLLTLNLRYQPMIWSRFDIFYDYEEMKWSLGINGTNILSGYSFYSNSPGISSFLISNNSDHSIYLDNILYQK